MFATHGYVVEKRKAPEGFITEPNHYRNYPQVNLPSAGYNKRCIETNSKVVWAMGWGDHGRLGLGTRENVIHTPTRVMHLLNDDYDAKQAKKRNKTLADTFHKNKTYQNSEVLNISLGGRHTLILMASGEVLACGHGRNGQLGVGATIREEQLAPHIVSFPKPLEPIDFVAAGGLASYAISRRGLVFAWGCGKQGRLGLGDKYLTRDCAHPTLIPELSSIQTTGVVYIAAGTHHAHAMTASGAVYSWGCNNAGQLGLGDTKNRSRPKLVREFTFRKCTVLGIATSHQFSMAIVQGPIYTVPEEDEMDSDEDEIKVENLEQLRIEGTHVKRRAMTAPGSLSQQTHRGTRGVALKPNDPRNQKNWSRINVRLAPSTNDGLLGKELESVVHTSFRPKHFDKEFLQYEPELLSRPHSRAGTPSFNDQNTSLLTKLKQQVAGAAAAYQLRATTAPALIRTRTRPDGQLQFVGVAEEQIIIDETEVLSEMFHLCDDTAEGPHFLQNKSVREKLKQQGRGTNVMINCLAVRKEKLLEACSLREKGTLPAQLISLIETSPALTRLRLLLIPNLIATRLRDLKTEIPQRVTVEEVLDLFLAPILRVFVMRMTEMFDLTLSSVQTQEHRGMVLLQDIRRVMETRNDAKILLKPKPSLIALVQKKSYSNTLWSSVIKHRIGSDLAGDKDTKGGSGGSLVLSKKVLSKKRDAGKEENGNETGNIHDEEEKEEEEEEGNGIVSEDANDEIDEDDVDDEDDEDDADQKVGKSGQVVKTRKEKTKKTKKTKMNRTKRTKKKTKRLTTKELREIKEAKIKEKKMLKRLKIGNDAFEEYDRQDSERTQMFAEDTKSISLDEFVNFALVTAGRSLEGHSIDGGSVSEPRVRQVVFVWGYGDARLGLGEEECAWFELPGRSPKLRHQTLPMLCRPLSDNMDSPIESISLGEKHGCALTRNRRVYTWGYNDYCQLGLRHNKNSPAPQELVLLEGCVDVQCSRNYSMALRHTGQLYTWGQGRDGVLGHGETISRCAPHLNLPMQGRRVQQIAAGPSHAMFITARAPTFGTTRPEYPIRFHSRVRGVARWNLNTNISSRLRNRDDLIVRAARFAPPVVKFEFEFPPIDLTDVNDFTIHGTEDTDVETICNESLTQIVAKEEQQKNEADAVAAVATEKKNKEDLFHYLSLTPRRPTKSTSCAVTPTSSATASAASVPAISSATAVPATVTTTPVTATTTSATATTATTPATPATATTPTTPTTPTTSLPSPRRLPPLPPLLDQIGVFTETLVQRNVYPLDVVHAHDARKQRRPLFNDRAIWKLTDGRDGEGQLSEVSDKDRIALEIQWYKHRDESFRERKKRNKASLVIQGLARRFKVRLWIFEVLRRKSAATMLQRRSRGRKGRRIAQRKREIRAAIFVQKRIRGRVYYNRHRGRIETAMALGRHKVAQKYAAVNVQKLVRGMLQRIVFAKLLKKKRKADKKAAKKRKIEEKRRAQAQHKADLREKSLAKARSLYDPTGEMDEDELVEIATAMGGEWDF